MSLFGYADDGLKSEGIWENQLRARTVGNGGNKETVLVAVWHGGCSMRSTECY